MQNHNAMKKNICLLLAFILLVCTQSFGQQNQEKLEYFNKVEKYRKMKNTGATFTVLGGALMIIGGVTMYNSTFNIWTGEESGNWEAGATAYIFGVAGLASGIPLWVVGAHNQRKYNQKLQGLSVRIDSRSQATGLTLSYRF
jgi:hypothetical protein